MRPLSAENLARRGLMRFRNGALEDALTDFNEALNREPALAHAWVQRGRTRRALGDADGAHLDFSTGLALDPGNFAGWGSRAYLYYDWQFWPEALADFRRACETRDRGTQEYHRYRMALVRARMGEEAAGNRELRKFLAARRGGSEWTGAIGEFLVGDLRERELLDLIATDEQACEGWFFVGTKRLIRRDTRGAMAAFSGCLDTGLKAFTEYRSARAEMGRLARS